MKLAEVEDEVRFRLGDWFDKPYYIDRSISRLAPLPKAANNLTFFSAREQTVASLNGFDERIVLMRGQWFAKREESPAISIRNASILNYVTQLGCQADFLVNMIDAHEIDYHETLGPSFEAPVITYNRRAGVKDVVLMPLVNYHNVQSQNYPLAGSDPLDWDSKKDRLVWRGRVSGLTADRTPASQFERHVLQGTDESAIPHLEEFHRYKIVRAAKGLEGADVLFSCPLEFAGKIPSTFMWMYGPDLSPKEQCESKYILCLEGNDIGSSMGWTLASNSVALMPIPTWDAIWTYGLEPWRHFVPIEADGSDLEEKYHWCLEHSLECKEIAGESRRFAQMMFEPSRKRLVDFLTIKHLEKSFLDFGSLSELDFPFWGRWIQVRRTI